MRDEKLSTTVTGDEKTSFRMAAAAENMNMSEKLRDLVYDYLEEEGHEVSRETTEGNPTVPMTDEATA